MREVELVFTKSKKFLPLGSWLVRLYTWQKFSHIARRVKLDWSKYPHYFQANEGKINYEYHTHFIKKHEIVEIYRIQVPENFYKSMIKVSWQQAGAKYSLLQNLGIVFVDICKLFGIKKCNPWKNGVNCSELIYDTVIRPFTKDKTYNKDSIKPHHIKKLLIKYKNILNTKKINNLEIS